MEMISGCEDYDDFMQIREVRARIRLGPLAMFPVDAIKTNVLMFLRFLC